jgi:hypothetical protein
VAAGPAEARPTNLDRVALKRRLVTKDVGDANRGPSKAPAAKAAIAPDSAGSTLTSGVRHACALAAKAGEPTNASGLRQAAVAAVVRTGRSGVPGLESSPRLLLTKTPHPSRAGPVAGSATQMNAGAPLHALSSSQLSEKHPQTLVMAADVQPTRSTFIVRSESRIKSLQSIATIPSGSSCPWFVLPSHGSERATPDPEPTTRTTT